MSDGPAPHPRRRRALRGARRPGGRRRGRADGAAAQGDEPQGGSRPPTPLATAAKVAAQYWGATPCAGRITFITRQPRAAGLEANSSAWVTFASPLGANNLAAPAESYTDCTIAFARWRWPTAASMRQDWAMFCTTMVHEWGHLLGRPHDTTPGSVMVPVFTDYSSVPPLCSASTPRRQEKA